MVYNLSHHHGSHLHHQYGSESTGSEQGIFPCILFVHRPAYGCCRIYCVQHAGYPPVGGAQTAVNIGVAVIIGYGETKNQGSAAHIAGCQLIIP